MKSNATIYSIQTHIQSNGLLHIETVVSGGVYNFSILGISAKNASDVKSRVYTALRTEGLLNLKSDNRKITVNLISDTEDIVTSCSELGIALSCITCISGPLWPNNILAIGSLSITGNIIPSNKLLQAIYVAMNQKINYIACSFQDVQSLGSEYVLFAEKIGIRFIVGQSLKEIVSNLRNCTLYEDAIRAVESHQNTYDSTSLSAAMKNMHEHPLVWNFFISLCGRHNLMIETNKAAFLDDLLAFGDTVTNSHGISRVLRIAHMCKIDDLAVQDIIKRQRYMHINSQTPKRPRSLRVEIRPEKDPVAELSHFIFLQDINSIHKDIWQEHYQWEHIHKIATCYVCPCGQTKKKCLCFQRSILKQKHALQTEHKPIYHIWTEQLEPLSITYAMEDIIIFRHILQKVHQIQFDRHCQEHTLSGPDQFTYIEYDFFNACRDTNLILPLLDPAALEAYHILTQPLNLKSKQNLLQTTQTLQDIEDCTYNRKGEISKETLLLAYSYIPKMDF